MRQPLPSRLEGIKESEVHDLSIVIIIHIVHGNNRTLFVLTGRP